MTSKDFLRRCESFKSLEKAAELFAYSVYTTPLPPIYRATLYDGFCVFTSYCLSPSFEVFPDSLLEGCSYVSFDKFTFSEFKIQHRYFLSFLSRLSAHQLSVVKSSSDFHYLLRYQSSDNV